MWQISRPPCKWCESEYLINLITIESQSYRHPRVLSIWVGEIFLCLISINSHTGFACRWINKLFRSWLEKQTITGHLYDEKVKVCHSAVCYSDVCYSDSHCSSILVIHFPTLCYPPKGIVSDLARDVNMVISVPCAAPKHYNSLTGWRVLFRDFFELLFGN